MGVLSMGLEHFHRGNIFVKKVFIIFGTLFASVASHFVTDTWVLWQTSSETVLRQICTHIQNTNEIPVVKYGYSRLLPCAKTNGKLISCGISLRRTLFTWKDKDNCLELSLEWIISTEMCSWISFIFAVEWKWRVSIDLFLDNSCQEQIIYVSNQFTGSLDQCRSMPINIMALIWNTSQCRSFIGIDRHWNQCQNFDRHWSTLGIDRGSPEFINSAIVLKN